MVYTWKPNSRIKAKAETAAEVFETLERAGELTPARVVEVSKPKDAPLHNEFEWNDRKAAGKYREIQARHLIMCLVVTDETDDVETRPVRAFFPVTDDGAYTHITRIASEEDMREALLERAQKELTAIQRKYQSLQEFLPVSEAIDHFMQKTRRKAQRISAQQVMR